MGYILVKDRWNSARVFLEGRSPKIRDLWDRWYGSLWLVSIVNDGDRNQCETIVSMITNIPLLFYYFDIFWQLDIHDNLPWIGNQSIDSHHWFAMYPPVHGKNITVTPRGRLSSTVFWLFMLRPLVTGEEFSMRLLQWLLNKKNK